MFRRSAAQGKKDNKMQSRKQDGKNVQKFCSTRKKKTIRCSQGNRKEKMFRTSTAQGKNRQ